jgi:hypothetical protein
MKEEEERAKIQFGFSCRVSDAKSAREKLLRIQP